MTARRHCLDRTPEALWVQVDEVGDKLVRMPNLDTVGLARLRGKVSQVERDNDAGLGYDGSGKYVSVIFWVGHCVHQLTRRIHKSVRRGPIHRVEPASDLAFRQIGAVVLKVPPHLIEDLGAPVWPEEIRFQGNGKEEIRQCDGIEHVCVEENG